MYFPRFLGLLVLSLTWVNGADPVLADEDAETPAKNPNIKDLKVNISTSFPEAAIFKTTLVNGRLTEAHVSIKNNEKEPVDVRMIAGSLSTVEANEPHRVLKNLTTVQFQSQIPAGESEVFGYKFTQDLHPADVTLRLVAVLQDANGGIYSLPAFDDVVTVVEAPTSIFDPQILFLYLILAGGFAGIAYFVYNTWFATLFPAKKKPGKGGERAKASTKGSKAVDPSAQVTVEGADGPAVATGAKTYDESWIPAHHLQRPEAKRGRSGTPSGKARK